MNLSQTARIKFLAFDVFGTVVDWRSSVIAEGEQLGKAKGINIDWAAFADAWRSIYRPFMDKVQSGELPWTKLDDLHRMMLAETLKKFAIESLSDDEKEHLNRVWHRLRPWPDSVPGLKRIKSRFIISPLSNGNISLLTNMAKHAGLPWDCILSAENVRRYKPDPSVYLLAPQLFDLAPEQVMMVAAHEHDLQSASKHGLRTAYVHRPLEHGPGKATAIPPKERYDIVAGDFLDLADQLSA
ncbi:MAG TPA: haloacid dehalogenase type II [Candidatus Binatia bacterium]|nr:haloacid dehalogenase type II [Candidatus Binatia bacterium]